MSEEVKAKIYRFRSLICERMQMIVCMGEKEIYNQVTRTTTRSMVTKTIQFGEHQPWDYETTDPDVAEVLKLQPHFGVKYMFLGEFNAVDEEKNSVPVDTPIAVAQKADLSVEARKYGASAKDAVEWSIEQLKAFINEKKVVLVDEMMAAAKVKAETTTVPGELKEVAEMAEMSEVKDTTVVKTSKKPKVTKKAKAKKSN